MSNEKNIPTEGNPKEQPAGEISSSDKPVDKVDEQQIEQTVIPDKAEILEIKNIDNDMEVHKHPHHVTHKKKWGEYLLEFFMLFLAVFLGFIAENIRENSVEHKRGIEYIKSFAEDLKKDTAQFSRLIIELNNQDYITDGIFTCYDSITHNFSTDCLKKIITNSVGFTDFIYTDRTIQQLKNAGGLRFIQNKDVADSIITYDAAIRTELIHQDVLEMYQQKAIDEISSITDFSSFHKLYRRTNTGTDFKIQLLKTDKAAINKYFNILFVFKSNLNSQMRLLQNLKLKATRLIIFLNDNVKGYKN